MHSYIAVVQTVSADYCQEEAITFVVQAPVEVERVVV